MRKWVVLAIALLSTFIVVLDTTVLNVALPTILRDFHTTLPTLDWVITGYSLTFATLLIIGGRLCDMYGPRRVFVVGAALFGCGSLLASESWSVGSLVVGEALIEGVGASLMLPASLSVISTTFSGRDRARAFAAWGGTSGAAVAFGPVLGGFLTTDYSWRWSFRINVVIAPIAIVCALLVMARRPALDRREPLDIPGAVLIAAAMFLLVFGLAEGGRYGWVTPVAKFSIARHEMRPSALRVSIIPAVFALALVALLAFYRYERAREGRGSNPLFRFGFLRYASFRYGLVTTVVVVMGQVGVTFTLALFLQESRHVNALENGLWVMPIGVAMLAASPAGARVANGFGTIWTVRAGLIVEAAGILLVAWSAQPTAPFVRVLPGLILFGAGLGLCSPQLTNVVLADIPRAESGVASGATTTARQVGAALGIATLGTIVTTQATSRAVKAIGASPGIPASIKSQAIASVRAVGANYQPLAHVPAPVNRQLSQMLSSAVASGTRAALLFALACVVAGAALAWLVPAERELRVAKEARALELSPEPIASVEVVG